jgi:uncharacterized protein
VTKDDARTLVLLDAGGKVLAERLERPRGALPRLLGLLVRTPLAADEALWLDPCGGIHTWGLRQAIDVLFLDREQRVLRAGRDIRPWRLVFAPRGTSSVIELPAGGWGRRRRLSPRRRLRLRYAAAPAPAPPIFLRQHFLYLMPLPQGQGSFLPARVQEDGAGATTAWPNTIR